MGQIETQKDSGCHQSLEQTAEEEDQLTGTFPWRRRTRGGRCTRRGAWAAEQVAPGILQWSCGMVECNESGLLRDTVASTSAGEITGTAKR
jgi:hypothetical protein